MPPNITFGLAGIKDLEGAARSARLMLYAWKYVRERDGLPEHEELNDAISGLERALGYIEK